MSTNYLFNMEFGSCETLSLCTNHWFIAEIYIKHKSINNSMPTASNALCTEMSFLWQKTEREG